MDVCLKYMCVGKSQSYNTWSNLLQNDTFCQQPFMALVSGCAVSCWIVSTRFTRYWHASYASFRHVSHLLLTHVTRLLVAASHLLQESEPLMTSLEEAT